MLLAGTPPIEVVMPNYFVMTDSELSKIVADFFAPLPGSPPIEMFYTNTSHTPGLSFWFKTAFAESSR